MLATDADYIFAGWYIHHRPKTSANLCSAPHFCHLVPFVNPLGWQCWFLFKQLNSRQTDFSHIWLAYKEENAFQSLAVTETMYV